MTYKNKSLLKEKKINLEIIVFTFSLILLFAIPLISTAANYGEGAYGSGIYGQVYCGDNVCDASESCSSCSEDCGKCVVSESGGGRIFAQKPYIEKIHQWNIIVPGKIASIEEFDEDFGIKNIEIEVNNEVKNSKLIVRKWHSKPDNISDAPGIVYKYLQVETENLESLKRAIINSRVEKGWISENDVENISLYKFNESSEEWNKLETLLVNEISDYYFYNTSLNSFSYFAISGESLIAIPEVPGEELIIEEIPEKTGKSILWIVIGISGIIIALVSSIILLIKLRKRKQFERFVEKQKEEYVSDYMKTCNELEVVVRKHEPGYEGKYEDIYRALKNRHDNRNKLIENFGKQEKSILKSPATLAVVLALIFAVFFALFIFAPFDFSFTGFVAEGRLPTIGEDSGNWGTILNEYLQQEHTTNGSHRNVSISGYLNVSGDANVTGNVKVDGNLTIGRDANVSGNLSVGDNLNVTGDIGVIGNLTLGDKITFRLEEVIDNIVDSWIQVTGNLNVTENLVVNKNVNITGNLSVLGNVNVSGEIRANNLTVGGNAEFEKNVNITNNLTIQNGSNLYAERACASGYTRVGLWCMDTDGSPTNLRSVTSDESAYTTVTVDAAAKLAIIRVFVKSDQDGTYESSFINACVIPGDSTVTTCTFNQGAGGQAVAAIRTLLVSETDWSVGEVTVRTNSAGQVKMFCEIVGVLSDASCNFDLVGYMD